MSRSFLVILFILSLLSLTVMVVAQVETHDLAIVSVTLSTTKAEVGDLVNTTVVVKNQGTESETFNVTTYYDTNVVETKTVQDLASNASMPLTFVWNTTGVSTGTYIIRGEAGPLPGETATGDNRLASSEGVIVFESPYVAVVPGGTVNLAMTPGMNYTISIDTDYNRSDVWGYEFELTFDPNVLQGVEFVNGDLITEDVGTTMWNPGAFDNAKGELSLTMCGFFAMPPAPMPVTSGPGTLANVTFTVVGYGDSYITLGERTRLIGYDTVIQNYNIIDEVSPNPGHILSGFFSNMEEVTHDIGVVSVTPSTTEVEVGELLNVTVVVENEGTVNEKNVVVKVYRDYEPGLTFLLVGERTVNLTAGAIESLVFVWNTTDVRPGDHTVTAVAIKLPREIDVGDNVLESDIVVTVRAREAESIPIFLIVGVAIVAFAAIALIWYALKRRSR